jgi:hypothetical protein
MLFRPDGTYMGHGETPMAEVLRSGRPVRNEELTMERPDGSRVRVLVNIAPITDEHGTILGAVNVFQDLSGQKLAEAARWQLASIVEWFSFDYHFQSMLRGVIDTRNVIYFLSVIGLALGLAFRSLESRRWS